MKKNGFTTLLKATAVLASIGGLAYLYRDKILDCPVVSSLKEKISGSEEDIFDEEDYFEESTNTDTEDIASREYVSLDIDSAKTASKDEDEMTLQEMEDAIEEEIQQETTIETDSDNNDQQISETETKDASEEATTQKEPAKEDKVVSEEEEELEEVDIEKVTDDTDTTDVSEEE